MKKLILSIIMALFIIFPVIFWARTLRSGMSFGDFVYYIARLLALAGFVLIFFQYVLSSKIKSLERGIGLDRMFIIHRLSGVIGFVFVLIHPLLLFAAKKLQGYGVSFLNPFVLNGAFTLLILSIAALAAILYTKLHLKYETWKNIHKVIYLILPLAFVHSIKLGSDLAMSKTLKIFWWVLLCLYAGILIYKIWTGMDRRRHPFRISNVLQESYDTWSLFFEGEKKDYKPGQFMIVKLARNGKVSESHPFTISSSPTREMLSISVKSVGDFTKTIKDTKTSDHAYIDEPYGIFSFLNYGAENLIFIAGGIGITPFISMLRYIYDKKLQALGKLEQKKIQALEKLEQKKIILMWGNKTSEDIVFKDELEKMQADMPSLKIVHVMSKQDDWQGEKGYIDAEKLKKYISDFQDGQFFICGPPPMMSKVIKTLKDLGVPKTKMHYERFALR